MTGWREVAAHQVRPGDRVAVLDRVLPVTETASWEGRVRLRLDVASDGGAPVPFDLYVGCAEPIRTRRA